MSPDTALTLANAQRVIDACVSKATALGKQVVVAVLDPAGLLVAFARMDGAMLLSVGFAQDKAWTVTQLGGQPTDQAWEEFGAQDSLRFGLVKIPRLAPIGGGVPLLIDGRLVGAVGVSGATEEEDVIIARVGAAAL